jgi:hypothetical protein
MNTIENIQKVRLLDNVLQQNSNKNNVWKPVIQAISNKTAGFTLELSDIGKYIRVNSATDVNVVVPSLDFPIGTCISFEQVGAGTITITSANETLNGYVISAGQYKTLQIVKVDITTWTVLGGTN